jgi:hypothetical protein
MPMKPRPIMPSMPGSGTAVPPEVDDVVELVEVPPEVVVVPPEVDDVVVVPPEVVDEVVVPPEVDEVVVPPEVVEVDDEDDPPHKREPDGWPQLQKCVCASAGVAVNAPAKTVAAAAMVAKRFMELPL